MLRFFPFGETFDARMGGRTLGAREPLCDVDEHYLEEVRLKAHLLETDPDYYFSGGAATLAAQWDVLELVLNDLSTHDPQRFELSKNGDAWRFSNHVLEQHTEFRFGDARTLSLEPLDFAGRQVQEDLVLVEGHGEGRVLRRSALLRQRVGDSRPPRQIVHDPSYPHAAGHHAVRDGGAPPAPEHQGGPDALAHELEH